MILDCGASRTSVGIFERAGEGLRLIDHAVQRLTAAGSGLDIWQQQTAAALGELRRRVKPTGRVVLVLPPHLTLTKLIPVPRVSASKVEQIVRFEAAQSIPYPLAEVTWDTAVAHEGEGHRELLLAAVRREVVGTVARAAAEAGFAPAAIMPAAVATWGAWRLGAVDTTAPVLVANLGARSAVLLMIAGKRFAGRTLAVGGQEAAASDGAARVPAGEVGGFELKTVGSRGAAESYASRLAREITRSVMHFGRQGGWDKPESIFVSGGASGLPGLAAALGDRLQLPVQSLPLGAKVTGGGGNQAADTGGVTGEMADLVGAAAVELLFTEGKMNLLPEAERAQEGAFGFRRRLAALGLAVATLLPPILHYENLADAARARADAIEAELAPVREQEARNRSALDRLEAWREEEEVWQGIHARRTAWLGLLADFQDRLLRVGDVWFDTLRAVPPNAGEPMRLMVSGRMLDRTNPLAKSGPGTARRVQGLLGELVSSPFVTSVEGERYDASESGLLRFDLSLVLEPGHPL